MEFTIILCLFDAKCVLAMEIKLYAGKAVEGCWIQFIIDRYRQMFTMRGRRKIPCIIFAKTFIRRQKFDVCATSCVAQSVND